MVQSKKKSETDAEKTTGRLRRLIMRAGWITDNTVARARAVWPQFMHKAWVSGAAATALVAIVMGASFLKSETIDYSFAKSQNCINNPLFLPRMVEVSGDNYQVSYTDVRTVLGYPVFSGHTCFDIKEPFLSREVQSLFLSHPLIPLGNKKIMIGSPEAAKVRLGRPGGLPIATRGALVLLLSEQDNAFDYALIANDKRVNCAKLDRALLCNLDNLNLKQDGQYIFSVARYFKEQPAGQVFMQNLKTVEPVRIVASSIKQSQKVQHAPKELVLTANKILKSSGDVSLSLITSDKRVPIDIDAEIKGNNIKIMFKEPLRRSAKFTLTVANMSAVDDAYQLKPYELKFSTSGGPKVTSVNIGAYGVSTAQSIVLNLDAELKSGQKLGSYISLSGNLKYSVSDAGKQIVISPSGSWPRCSKFTIEIKDGLKNKYGINGGSAWQFSSRTICQSISSIGSSLEGREIYVHRFGNGSQTVIFVGGTHGDEPSSVYILSSLIDNLEASYDSIPSDKTVLVVPNINPDAIYSGTRTNARGVDLNRNFPADDWKKDVVMPGGDLNEGGGGKNPLSEPESAALANYVLAQNPKLVMNYHAVGSLVIGNGAGNANSIAASYATSTGYWLTNGAGVFEYDTTGAMTDWLRDKHGVPAVLIELSSYYGNEFWNHQSAMWNTIGS